ncbi:hypothetical protein, partial [Klebsiella pneumoniae]
KGFTSGDTAGRRSRKTAGRKQGKRGEEMRAARQRGPVFLAPQARGFCSILAQEWPIPEI